MEFYSERCQDWLNKSQRIHPDKLAMEVERFKKMHDECNPDNTEAKDDLALTVQLLEERLHEDQLVQADDTASISPEAYPLSDTPNEHNAVWDLNSLTDPAGVEIEVLDLQTKAARKQALLDHPSIGLGAAVIKPKNSGSI